MSFKIRVALGTIYPFDENYINGGVEAVAFYLMHALALRSDVDLHVVSCNRTINNNYTETRGNVTFHWLATGKRLYNLRAATLDTWRVRKVYDEIQPQVIHAQGFSEYALAAAGDKYPLLLSIHGVEFYQSKMRSLSHYSGLSGYYRRIIGKYIGDKSIAAAKGIVSNAGDYIPSLLGTQLFKKKIYSIFNPIDSRFSKYPISDKTEPHILWVGNITERKNLLDLIKAMEIVHNKYPNAKLKIVGKQSDPAYARRIIGEVQLRNLDGCVEFTGSVSQEQLFSHYKDAAIFVMTSLEETAPMALAQAMAMGLPVVAMRVGGIPWMLDENKNGFLVNIGDFVSLAASINTLLYDKQLMTNMGIFAKISANKRFSPNVVAEKTVQAYFDLAKGLS